MARHGTHACIILFSKAVCIHSICVCVSVCLYVCVCVCGRQGGRADSLVHNIPDEPSTSQHCMWRTDGMYCTYVHTRFKGKKKPEPVPPRPASRSGELSRTDPSRVTRGPVAPSCQIREVRVTRLAAVRGEGGKAVTGHNSCGDPSGMRSDGEVNRTSPAGGIGDFEMGRDGWVDEGGGRGEGVCVSVRERDVDCWEWGHLDSWTRWVVAQEQTRSRHHDAAFLPDWRDFFFLGCAAAANRCCRLEAAPQTLLISHAWFDRPCPHT